MSRTSDEVAAVLMAQAEARRNDPREVWGIPWGLKGLDKFTGGIQREEMTVLMARPGVGKTTLMEQVVVGMCDWMTTPDGIKYLEQYAPRGVIRIVSIEMTAENFQQRITSKLARVSMAKVRGGTLSDEQYARWQTAAQTLATLPIEIEDGSSSIEKTQRFLSGQERPDSRPTLWWGVDYVQIHQTGLKYSAGTTADISLVAGALRDIAKKIAPGLLLSQMSREVDKREDRRPMLGDLKGSGTLEEAASLVLGLYNGSIYKKIAPEDINNTQLAELGILKQRNGPLGTIKLVWHPMRQWFEDVSHIPELQDDEEDAA